MPPHARALLCLLALALHTGCATLLVSFADIRTQETRATLEAQNVSVETEPSGAQVVADNAVLGETPLALSLEYTTERRIDRYACAPVLTGMLLDVTVGVGAMGFSAYRIVTKDGVSVVPLAALGVFGLVEAVLGPVLSHQSLRDCPQDADVRVLETHVLPHEHHFLLRKEGFTPIPLDLRVPTETPARKVPLPRAGDAPTREPPGTTP